MSSTASVSGTASLNNTTSVSPVTSKSEVLRNLRTSFDQAFAAPSIPAIEGRVRLISIRCGDRRFAIRTTEIIGLAKVARIAPVPSRIPELLGIVGIRGVLVPVFDLARCVGSEAPLARPQRVVLVQRDQPIALAFDDFDGLVDVAKDAFFSEEQAAGDGPGRLLVRIETSVRLLIDIPQIVAALRKRAGLASTERSES